MTRQPVALGYRPSLPSGAPDPACYRLQITTFTGQGIGADAYSTEYLTFPDKPAALAHAKAIGALFTA
jgi:hypothetical protein